jgi:hypothetical protein
MSPPGDVCQDDGEYRHRDLDIAQVGEEFGEAVRVRESAADLPVDAQKQAARDDLPGDQREEEGGKPEKEKKGGRPPRNRGGSSEAADQIGWTPTPGGLGRATVRSVRRSGAGSSGCVREGTTRS